MDDDASMFRLSITVVIRSREVHIGRHHPHPQPNPTLSPPSPTQPNPIQPPHQKNAPTALGWKLVRVTGPSCPRLNARRSPEAWPVKFSDLRK